MENYVRSCTTKNCALNKLPEKERSDDVYHEAVGKGWEHIRKTGHPTIYVTRTTLFTLNMHGGMKPVERPKIDTQTMKAERAVDHQRPASATKAGLRKTGGARKGRKKTFVGQPVE